MTNRNDHKEGAGVKRKSFLKKALMKIWTTALGGALILSLIGCTEAGTVSFTAGEGQESGGASSEGGSVFPGQSERVISGGASSAGTAVAVTAETMEVESVSDAYTERDQAGTYDESSAVIIDLQGKEASASDESACSITESLIRITKEGTYILSGSFTGQIVVEAAETDKVQLVLSDAELTNDASAAIYVVSADKVFLTLADGTENKVTTGSSFVFAEGEDEPDAAVFSKEDLVINGSGSLVVSAGYQDGIVSKDDLKICGGSIEVHAVDDGIRGKDSVRVLDGTITVSTSEGHAIKSNNDTDEGLGYIRIDGGELNLTSGLDGLHAVTGIYIAAGEVTISAQDDGIHADGSVEIDGGTVNIANSYEGIEGLVITVNDGDITVVSSDDAFNATDGSGSTMGGFGGAAMGQGAFGQTSSASMVLTVNGGRIVVVCNGDGLDSNGNLYVTGGEIYVNGPVSGGNGSVDIGDFGCEALISGGEVVTAGASDMAINFSASSSQPSVMVYFGTNYPAGTEISLAEEGGQTVIEYEPLVSFSCAIFSSGALTVGKTYTVQAGGNVICSFTLSQAVMSVDSAGNVSSGFGGFGGMGGAFGGFGQQMPGQAPSGGQMPGGRGGMPGQGSMFPGQSENSGLQGGQTGQ